MSEITDIKQTLFLSKIAFSFFLLPISSHHLPFPKWELCCRDSVFHKHKTHYLCEMRVCIKVARTVPGKQSIKST